MTPHETSFPPQDLLMAVDRHDGCTVVAINGELDIACAHALREQLLGVLGTQGGRLVADLSGVTFCDASGLSALTAASRRAALLGGTLCVAAPSAPVTTVLRLAGPGLPLEVFPTVRGAIGRLAHPGRPRADGIWHLPPGLGGGQSLSRPVRPPRRTTAGNDNLRGAAAAVLAQADAWRDADPERRLTRPLHALAVAHASGDAAGLATAARSLLGGLLRHPLTHSPAVAVTATRLRRLLASSGLLPLAVIGLSVARDAA